MLSARYGDETIDLQQKLARVHSLLEASRRVHSTIKLDDVLAGVLEIAAKELEAEGAFFVSSDAQLESRARVFGDVPDDWTRWSERTEIPGYASAPMTGSRGERIAHLVVYRPEPLTLEEADFLEGLALQSALAVGNAQHHEKMIEWERVGGDDKHAELKETKRYRLNPGEAGIYQNGAIHSIDYPDRARFIRVTGTNLDKIERVRFDLKTGEVHQMTPQQAT